MTAPTLPERLPDDPLPLVEAWIADATRTLRNPTAMALATVEPGGRPAVRMVLCRGFDVAAGWFVLERAGDRFTGGAWSRTRLEP